MAIRCGRAISTVMNRFRAVGLTGPFHPASVDLWVTWLVTRLAGENMNQFSSLACISVFAVLCLGGQSKSHADDSATSKDWISKGVKITDALGMTTGIEVPDPSRLSDDDWQKIAQLTHLQRLRFGKGLNNQQLSILTRLRDVTSFTTNGSDLDDEGVARFAQFKKLQVLTFFHPGKNFRGTGLEGLAALRISKVSPSRERPCSGMKACPRFPNSKP